MALNDIDCYVSMVDVTTTSGNNTLSHLLLMKENSKKQFEFFIQLSKFKKSDQNAILARILREALKVPISSMNLDDESKLSADQVFSNTLKLKNAFLTATNYQPSEFKKKECLEMCINKLKELEYDILRIGFLKLTD